MMRQVLVSAAVAAVCLMAAASQVQAVTLSPNPSDLYGLDHYYSYTWGIQYAVPDGMQISSATLKIFSINNTDNDRNNALYIHLLDNPQSGVHYTYDGQDNVDAFAGQGALVAKYTDTNFNHSETLTYDLGALGLLGTLNTDAADGKFGFGFDPDCHFENNGVQLCMEFGRIPPHQDTPPVPEPITMAGLLLAVGAVSGYARKRMATR
jgi:hypothetical protein